LKIDGRLIGVFTLMSSLEGALDEEELELLDEMAEDLSFGIASIRARQKLDEAELIARRASTHDLLTDLPLAAPFIELVAQYLARARRAEEPLAVVVAHIAHMQEVFDNLGYEPGHVIIKEIARRLRGVAELDGVLARLNLEDFGILVRGDAFAAQTVADLVVAQCTLPIELSDAQFHPQIAMGVCYFPGQGDKPEVLARRATIAAREAAHRGISLLSCQGSIRQENSQWLTIAGELREALEQKALTLHYQGKFDLVSGERVGAEGLIRWFHPSKGPMSPAQFVPIAEQMGLIRELTFFVAEVAIRQLHDWMKKDIYLPIAVNLSVRNLYDAKLLERIEGLLVTWGIPPELLEFEITESALMEEPEVARAATARLRGNGSKIYIDDFGTGYSSLSYLVSLPVHAVKIDRAFVVQMTKSSQARAVVASIISMAHQLGLKVVAEGVESAEEMAELRNMGCDNVQGYFTGRPMSATDFLAAPSNPLAARNDLHKPAE
jgi:diguanylate cyclase (GGDEF)-like protein